MKENQTENYILRENLFLTNLPKIISKEEQKELFSLYSKTYSQEVREKIIINNIRLVINIVNTKIYETDMVDKRELVEVGIIGLIKAVDSFNIEKKYEFTTYASRCIKNEILMFMRSFKKREKDISLSTPINVSEDGKILLYEEFIKDENIDLVVDYEDKESLKEIFEAMKILSDREREILLLKYGFNEEGRIYKDKELAELYNLSQPYISRIKNSAIDKVKTKLNYQNRK